MVKFYVKKGDEIMNKNLLEKPNPNRQSKNEPRIKNTGGSSSNKSRNKTIYNRVVRVTGTSNNGNKDGK